MDKKDPPKPRALRRKDGSILQFNDASYDFVLTGSDDPGNPELTLDISLSKFLDSSLLDLSLESDHVLLKVKGKPVFQLLLPEEIFTERSEALRSQSTGHLLLRMPKVNHKEIIKAQLSGKENATDINGLRLGKMVIEDRKSVAKVVESSFVDDPDVPPLE